MDGARAGRDSVFSESSEEKGEDLFTPDAAGPWLKTMDGSSRPRASALPLASTVWCWSSRVLPGGICWLLLPLAARLDVPPFPLRPGINTSGCVFHELPVFLAVLSVQISLHRHKRFPSNRSIVS